MITRKAIPSIVGVAVICSSVGGTTDVSASSSTDGVQKGSSQLKTTFRTRSSNDDKGREKDKAPKLEDVADGVVVTPEKVRQFKKEVAARISHDFEVRDGSVPAKAKEKLGTTNYYTADDIEVYALPPEGDEMSRWVTVPVGFVVYLDGSIEEVAIPENGSELGPPTFSGSWGAESIFYPSAITVTDGPSLAEQPDCSGNNAIGEVRSRLYRRKLADTSATYDYFGVALDGVAEILQGNGGFNCSTFIDQWSTKYRTTTASGGSPIYAAQGPGSMPGTNCTTTTATAGVTVGAVNGSVTQTFSRCDSWNVSGYLAGASTNLYGLSYNNGDRCGTDDVVGAVSAVIRINQGVVPYSTVLHTVDPDQNPGTCSGCPG